MEKIRQNIFGIGEVYELQKEGQWVEKNRESYREYGYLQALQTPLDRLDYSNDTITTKSRVLFTNQWYSHAATGNTNFGYFIGGNKSGFNNITDINRISYSNDTTLSSRGGLLIGRNFLAAAGNNNFGYAGGGISSIPLSLSSIERVDYSNDNTTASVRGPLSLARISLAATGNSNFGYFGGGNQSPSVSTVDRITYSNDTATASVRGSLQLANFAFSATGNNNFGYFLSSWGSSSTHRLDYANDTTLLSVRGPLSFTKHWYPGSTGNTNFGYSAGGSTTTSTAGAVSTIDRLDYSNDTNVASVRGPLSISGYSYFTTSSASFGGSPVSYLGAPWVATAPYGYFSGAALGALDRVDYTNDTAATTLRSQLSVDRSSLAATGNSSYGYYGGGGSPTVSTVDRLDYSSDSATASIRGPLSLARALFSATGNSNFGYFGGGYAPGTISTIDRIDYANDSVGALNRSLLSTGRRALGATGNSNFGYFGGGRTSVNISTVDRIDYSNDTTTASVRGPLSLDRYNIGATGTTNFGYYAGGALSPSSTVRSVVDRVDYSNDTSATLVRGTLSSNKSASGATGNSNFGYFGGFNIGGTDNLSGVDRIDYSNDTQTASARGPLSSARSSLAASSSQAYGGAPNTTTDPIPTYIRANTVWDDSNTLDVPYKRVLGSYGYFGGGIPFPTSTVDRIDYSNDLSTASIRGPLSLNRRQFSATGNSNFGYYIAGNIATPTVVVTSIDRVDYSNDGTTALLRGNTTSGSNGRSFGATGNSNFGYIGNWAYVSTTNRIDYSNDNLTASVRGPLSSAKSYTAATGTQNFGYFGAGAFFPGPIFYSTVDRIDYSNDLSRSSVRGPLSLARYGTGSTGNSNFGYFGGGLTFPPSVYYSTIDRIDYSNDTTTASVRGPLSLTKRYLAATGNSNFGYFGGGSNPEVPALYSYIQRIDYSNDTQTASLRGLLSLARQSLAASTNARNS